MTNVFNVYTPDTSKQPRGASANAGRRPPTGVGRLWDGHNHPGARKRESNVRTPPAPKGPQDHAGQATHAKGNPKHRGPVVHPAAGGGVRPTRPRRLPRDGEPLDHRSNPAQRKRRVRKSKLTPEQGAAIRALSATLFDTLIGYGVRKGALLQHCLRAVRDSHSEWRKRLQSVSPVGARGEPSGSQLPSSTADCKTSPEAGTIGPIEKPAAVEGTSAAGDDQPTLCRSCTGHNNVY
ncbi:putative long-distance movement protein [Ixeridium yellow mottle virus 2]|uniref:Putative long-distance movement protein n=1 Tax=Ixeridium yellow mottle virus 2 TaxID=1817526 RepID=A0A1U8YLV3_9TOMB|nr:putative long-distance movement protein [Ixeridium yellow mottle virus 2]AMR60141.1 putative long-distance movement protein [Ixeridium yellow mottle virus 2]